ncbi:hypothetical protein [Mesorhizobium sp. B2-7-2]|uniref:hypothetical protein n=1 Tax=Mesorhizobium sp. B2-7-2 TaxID=2589908 RepID=UPI00112BC606|nr:hypothetical protein [Mesorhizobium sp. B2-7-2]TPJ28046.1 hypothetical protein FJ425_13485 [Mesorhizobium sp. B2-7-2]
MRNRRCEEFHGSGAAAAAICRRSATGLVGNTTPANINPLHAAAIWQCNALAEESRGLHDKFTPSGNSCRPAFAFHRRFRQMGPEMPFSRPVRHGMVMEQMSKIISQ